MASRAIAGLTLKMVMEGEAVLARRAVSFVAPNLAECTAMVVKGTSKDGEDTVFAMGHCRPGDCEFRDNLSDATKNHQGFKWELVAVQHATFHQTDRDGDIEDSLEDMAVSLEEVLDIPASQTRRMGETGIPQSFGVRRMHVDIDESGRETVHRNEGGGLKCTIL